MRRIVRRVSDSLFFLGKKKGGVCAARTLQDRPVADPPPLFFFRIKGGMGGTDGLRRENARGGAAIVCTEVGSKHHETDMAAAPAAAPRETWTDAAANSLLLFFNAAQETALMPASGRRALPEGAVAVTAAAFCATRGHVVPLPLATESQQQTDGSLASRVRVTKDDEDFVGDLVSLDATSVTLTPARGITQTIQDYDDLALQRRDRPIVSIGNAADARRRCPNGVTLSYVRTGLSWSPSFVVYLGDTHNGGAPIASIVALATLVNDTDGPVHADQAWVVAAHVPLPSAPLYQPYRPRAESFVGVSRDASSQGAARPTSMMAMAAEAPPMAPRPMAVRRALVAPPSPVESNGMSDDMSFGRASGRKDGDKTGKESGARYALGAIDLERNARVTIPLLRLGAPTQQAAVYYCALTYTRDDRVSNADDGADDVRGGTGGKQDVLRGYRFVVPQPLPKGSATVFDAHMQFVAVADLPDTVPGEPIDLVTGVATDLSVDSTINIETVYEPVLQENDRRRGGSFSATSRSESDDDKTEDGGMATGLGPPRNRAPRPAAPNARDQRNPLMRAIDHVLLRGNITNGTRDTALVVFTWRPPKKGTVLWVQPESDRTVHGRLEWTVPIQPGRSMFAIAARIYRGERIVPTASSPS